MSGRQKKQSQNTGPKKQPGKSPPVGHGAGGKPNHKQAGKDTFEAVAKRLECDEDRAHFEAKLGKLAKAKPKGK